MLSSKVDQEFKKLISFPMMGNYDVPVKYLLSNVTNTKITNIPSITNRTIELGNRYSPEFVCTPFKYTLGTLIESLDNGANVLVQAGGGCRYGYYSELQEQILRDLDYNFIFINFMTKGRKNFKKIIEEIKKVEPNFKLIKSLYYLFITIKMVKYMDLVDDYIRENIGFEVNPNSFINLNKEMLNSFKKVKTNVGLYFKYLYYLKKLKNVKTNKPSNHLKIGLIGELYTLMEPFSNYELERELASYGMSIKRYTNVYYLLFQKKRESKKYIKYAKEYVTYKMGADATGSARKLIGLMFNASVVKNEITAHAVGTLAMYPSVHTILEIGGQDSKIIIIDNGVVVDYSMNTLCAAGTGAFLTSQAKRLGIPIEDFGELALKSKNPVKIAARCTVFAESDLIHKAQVGYLKEDIIAGLCKSIVINYLNNVGKGKKIKSPIVFQGGVSKNKGVLKYFEEVLNSPVTVLENGHLMGAIGIAILSKSEKLDSPYNLNIDNIFFETQGNECTLCPNNCEIINIYKDNKLVDTWGNRCPNGASKG